MALSHFNRRLLAGTGIAEDHAKTFLDWFDTVIDAINANTALTDRITIVGGNTKIAMTAAGTTYVIWNSVSSRYEFYIGGALQGILDATGFSAEPGE